MVPHGCRLSRCTDPSNAPQRVHWAVVGDIRTERELVTAVARHVARAALPDAIAEIKAVLQRIATCRAVDADDIKNISRERDLFEIRSSSRLRRGFVVDARFRQARVLTGQQAVFNGEWQRGPSTYRPSSSETPASPRTRNPVPCRYSPPDRTRPDR